MEQSWLLLLFSASPFFRGHYIERAHQVSFGHVFIYFYLLYLTRKIHTEIKKLFFKGDLAKTGSSKYKTYL